ncbi:uncharacterized protein LOC133779840 [Humulus lupulus]|uniref:uncharacterized protein LOC133779840 n=1 Tax=Humulus lupulus TaxID=3486 RepID=UPI002B417A23|nr:uncharacterized protein LOC133779840 [Humulus lupulus]
MDDGYESMKKNADYGSRILCIEVVPRPTSLMLKVHHGCAVQDSEGVMTYGGTMYGFQRLSTGVGSNQYKDMLKLETDNDVRMLIDLITLNKLNRVVDVFFVYYLDPTSSSFVCKKIIDGEGTSTMREQCEYVNVEDIGVHESDETAESDSSFVFDDEFVETEYVGTTDNEDWLVEERKIMGELSNSEAETNIQDVIVQNLEDDDCEEELDEEQKVGMVFKNAKVFREAIHQYGIKNGRDISFPRNDKDIIRAKFKGNRPWVLYASQFDSKNPTLKVKTYVNKHACGRISTNTNATSTWIPKTYSESLQPGKQFSCGDFLAKVTKDFRITITKTQVYKVKKKGAIFLEGSMKDQYGKLWDYAEELRARNLGSTSYN